MSFMSDTVYCVNCGFSLEDGGHGDVIRRVRMTIGGLGSTKHYDVWLCDACVEKLEAVVGTVADWVEDSSPGIEDISVKVYGADNSDLPVESIYTRWGFGSVPPHVSVRLAEPKG